ncbi:DUF488 domain-containing protein [Bosea sp. (in: a-proteobacteria)]|uniref:DUF488 domain-containing protein n=1 Tax=Bosea sp. (in: a-proteobacteria) TaxID=1871050 RepID=UPI002FC5FD54
MSVRIVRLGTPRQDGEGTRIGTVRRVPRGVPKERYASENWFDVWFPVLSPTPELMAQAKAAESEKDWAGFARAFKAEMAEPAPRHALDLLAVLSQDSDFSVGCYCEEEVRCHRSVLRLLLTERGARLA